MNINEVNALMIKSVLKDCGELVESLSENSDSYTDTNFYDELLADIDRSIVILNGKE